nr:PAS domain-containing protein [Herbaspirillum rubrisubalbicans]
MEFFNSRTGRTSLLAFQLVRSDLGELLGISGSAVDITARVAAERTVRDSEEHFHRAIDLNPNIPWAADERGVVDYIGPTFEWQPELNNVQRHQQWVARILEDDRQRVRQEWLDNLPSGRPFSTEFRVLWPDGQWRWMRSRASPHADGEGRILRWYGLIVDISVERALQQRIALLEQQLQPVRPSGDA